MKAPDKTKVKPYKLTIKSVDGSPDTVYVQLDKVKELIESERCEGSGFGELAINETINFLLDQLEGLE